MLMTDVCHNIWHLIWYYGRFTFIIRPILWSWYENILISLWLCDKTYNQSSWLFCSYNPSYMISVLVRNCRSTVGLHRLCNWTFLNMCSISCSTTHKGTMCLDLSGFVGTNGCLILYTRIQLFSSNWDIFHTYYYWPQSCSPVDKPYNEPMTFFIHFSIFRFLAACITIRRDGLFYHLHCRI